MRIVHVSATFPPYQGGTGNVCYSNAKELARRGHEVLVYTATYQGAPTHEEREGFTIHRLASLFRFGNAPFLPGFLSIKDCDIIHLHHPFIFGAELIWLVSKLRKTPYVLTHHNDLIGVGYRRYLFNTYSAVSTRLVFSGASRFAVVSKDHAAHCCLAPLFRQRWEDVLEVPNGVDIDLFRHDLDGAAVRQQFTIPNDALVILFVGALDRAHHFKGVDYLIKAFALIPDQKTRLMIVGGGELKKQFEELAIITGVADRVVFTGVVPNEELPPFYNAADIFVLPSFPPESFGLVLIEAMACGLPVIAHRIPGVRSVVSDGKVGFLVQPGSVRDLAEKLTYILALPEKQRRVMGQAGREEVVERYAWDRIGSRLESIYQAVVEAPADQYPVDRQVDF